MLIMRRGHDGLSKAIRQLSLAPLDKVAHCLVDAGVQRRRNIIVQHLLFPQLIGAVGRIQATGFFPLLVGIGVGSCMIRRNMPGSKRTRSPSTLAPASASIFNVSRSPRNSIPISSSNWSARCSINANPASSRISRQGMPRFI